MMASVTAEQTEIVSIVAEQPDSVAIAATVEADPAPAYAATFSALVSRALLVPKKTKVAARSDIKASRDTQQAAVQQAELQLENKKDRIDFTKVLTTKNQLYTFRPLLHATGFKRPEWQDLSVAAVLGKPDVELKPFVILIDPGHGGTDQGAVGHNGLLEKDLTLDIARRIRQSLTQHTHINIKLTRSHDYGLSRSARIDAIQRSAADVVISLHFNHLPQTDVNLVESYFAGPENIRESLAARHAEGQANEQGSLHRTVSGRHNEMDFGFTEGSARLADTLQQRVFAEVSINDENVQNAGVKKETLFVLTQSFIPSVLMELSCLSHAPEATRLEDMEYRDSLANALVEGILDYHDSLQRAPLRNRGDVGA